MCCKKSLFPIASLNQNIERSTSVFEKVKFLYRASKRGKKQSIGSYPGSSVDDLAVFMVENMVRRSFVTCVEQKTAKMIVASVGFSVNLRTKSRGSQQNLAPTFVKTVKERPVSARQVFQSWKGALRALQGTRITVLETNRFLSWDLPYLARKRDKLADGCYVGYGSDPVHR